jgi:hypothetical protein
MKNIVIIVLIAIAGKVEAQKKYSKSTECIITDAYTPFAGVCAVHVASRFGLYLNFYTPLANAEDTTSRCKIINDKNRTNEYSCNDNRCIDYYYYVQAKDSSIVDTITVHYTCKLKEPFNVITAEIKASFNILYQLAYQYWRSNKKELNTNENSFRYTDTEGYLTFTSYTDKVTFFGTAPEFVEGRIFIEAKK